jgi:16S rRNA (cytosine967-C5)-methyltransferase
MLAIETLSWMELRKLSERLALTRATRQLGIKDPEAIKLAHKLVYETTRRQNFIDHLINSALSPKSIEDFRIGLRAFLRLYVYETKIVNSNLGKAINIARMGRSILGWQELQDVEEKLGEMLSMEPNQILSSLSDEEEKIGLSTFHQTWFVKYCFKLFGKDETLKFLESSNKVPPTYIRINTLKDSEENLLRKIEADGTVLEKVPQLRQTYRLIKSQKPIIKTKSFLNGLFYIQDKASCLAAEIANPSKGSTLIDLCAAPGAKTTYLAQLMGDEGTIYSVDYSKRRMTVWKREIKRMGIMAALPIIADARRPLPIKSPVDLVVLDPPCTGTGAFSRLPSAKWRITEKSISTMARIQWEMLSTAADRIKEGGCLVYSTRSIIVEENEMLIERLLKQRPNFKLLDATPRIGVTGLRGLTECQRLYPHMHGCDGFFVAKIMRLG